MHIDTCTTEITRSFEYQLTNLLTVSDYNSGHDRKIREAMATRLLMNKWDYDSIDISLCGQCNGVVIITSSYNKNNATLTIG